MEPQKQLAKNTLILTIGKICTQSFSFFLLPLYTSALTTEELGLVDLIVTYTGLMIPLVYAQFDQAIFRYLIDFRQKSKERKMVITTSCAFSVVQMLLLSAVFAIIQGLIASEYKFFLLYMILASIMSSCMLQVARGFGDTVGYTLGSGVSAIVQVVCNVLFLLVLDMGAEGMLLATVLGHVAAAVFLFVYERVWKDLVLRCFNWPLLKEMIRYCIPLVPNQLSWWAITASDRVIVSIGLGAAFNGLLSVGHKFSSMFVAVYNIFHLAWSESAATYIHEPQKVRDSYFTAVITDMFRLFMCAAIGVIAVMPFVFPLMVHGDFREAYGLIPLFMLAMMFHVVTGLYGAIYVALKETTEIAKTSLMAGVINIISHLLLIKYIGIYAAGVSSVIAYAMVAIKRCRNIQKYVSVRMNGKDLRSIILVFLITVIAYYCSNLLVQGIVLLVVVIYSVMSNKRVLFQFCDGIKNKWSHNKG